jgi:hypothetical protein
MKDFRTFREHALQGLSLLKGKQRTLMNKTEIESWVVAEYQRLCGNEGHQWQHFKTDGYRTDIHFCMRCGLESL